MTLCFHMSNLPSNNVTECKCTFTLAMHCYRFLCRPVNGLKAQTNKISVRCLTLMISTVVQEVCDRWEIKMWINDVTAVILSGVKTHQNFIVLAANRTYLVPSYTLVHCVELADVSSTFYTMCCTTTILVICCIMLTYTIGNLPSTSKVYSTFSPIMAFFPNLDTFAL